MNPFEVFKEINEHIKKGPIPPIIFYAISFLSFPLLILLIEKPFLGGFYFGLNTWIIFKLFHYHDFHK